MLASHFLARKEPCNVPQHPWQWLGFTLLQPGAGSGAQAPLQKSSCHINTLVLLDILWFCSFGHAAEI